MAPTHRPTLFITHQARRWKYSALTCRHTYINLFFLLLLVAGEKNVYSLASSGVKSQALFLSTTGLFFCMCLVQKGPILVCSLSVVQREKLTATSSLGKQRQKKGETRGCTFSMFKVLLGGFRTHAEKSWFVFNWLCWLPSLVRLSTILFFLFASLPYIISRHKTSLKSSFCLRGYHTAKTGVSK